MAWFDADDYEAFPVSPPRPRLACDLLEWVRCGEGTSKRLRDEGLSPSRQRPARPTSGSAKVLAATSIPRHSTLTLRIWRARVAPTLTTQTPDRHGHRSVTTPFSRLRRGICITSATPARCTLIDRSRPVAHALRHAETDQPGAQRVVGGHLRLRGRRRGLLDGGRRDRIRGAGAGSAAVWGMPRWRTNDAWLPLHKHCSGASRSRIIASASGSRRPAGVKANRGMRRACHSHNNSAALLRWQ